MSSLGNIWFVGGEAAQAERLERGLGERGVRVILDQNAPITATISAVVLLCVPDDRLERILTAQLLRGVPVLAFGVELPPRLSSSPLTRCYETAEPSPQDLDWLALLAHAVLPRPPAPVRVPGIDNEPEDATAGTSPPTSPSRSESNAGSPRHSDPFMRIAAHELRSPMVSLLGTTESLLAGVFGDIPDHLLGPMQTLERGGRHMLDTLNRVLDLVRLEQGNATPEFASVGMKGILDSVGFVLRNCLSRRNHVLTTQLDPPGLCIESDAQWIAQILVNLVSNAIKFTPPSGRIVVSVEALPEMEIMKLSVSDSGIGIATNDLERIFQPFVRLARRGYHDNSPGCGIGLSLIARMAAALGGRVEVRSTLGTGSTFTVTLPLGRIPAVAPLPAKTSPLTSASGLFVASVDLHVLVIDDNQSNIDTLRPYLESKGWTVTASTDPVAALSKIEEIDARVLVLDIQMPILDGYEVARRIRAHSSATVSALPIVALSALSGVSAERHALEVGCTLHIEKPSRLSFIESSLRRLVIDSLLRRHSKAVQGALRPA